MDASGLSVAQLCGQLIVGGFDGPTLPPPFRAALAAGQRAGAILFRRNCTRLEQVKALCAEVAVACPEELPAVVGIDQEGGRVVRLPAPFPTLPPMRELGATDDVAATRQQAERVGAELAALGFNVNFAPVLDVDSNPDNPVIGDRSFGTEPAVVSRHGVAFVRGLQSQGVAACGKHFPGHGDTAVDSHVALPVVDAAAARLDEVELAPFRAACAAGVASIMSAHVVVRAYDSDRPATLSSIIATELLRERLGFEGVLFSDDMEMGAISTHWGIEQAAIAAVRAGCDLLLVCSDEQLQQRAHRALVQEAEEDEAFLRRCRRALERGLALRRRFRALGDRR